MCFVGLGMSRSISTPLGRTQLPVAVTRGNAIDMLM
jgi:hypothetical protein